MDDINQKDTSVDDNDFINEPESRDKAIDKNLYANAPVPDYSREEEAANEFTVDEGIQEANKPDENDVNMGTQMNSIIGWSGLILSVLSFFMLPIVFGGAGIVVGFISRNRDAEWLGNTAIVVGAISIILSLFVRPFI